MIILDTDHFNILQIGKGLAYDTLSAHMDSFPNERYSTTVITFEEHMRGWLAGIRRARDVADQVRPYDQLIRLVHFFRAWEILRFSEDSAARFVSLRQQRVRIGTQDLKIAAIAVEAGALLLSANVRDYEQVPGLRIENWLR